MLARMRGRRWACLTRRSSTPRFDDELDAESDRCRLAPHRSLLHTATRAPLPLSPSTARLARSAPPPRHPRTVLVFQILVAGTVVVERRARFSRLCSGGRLGRETVRGCAWDRCWRWWLWRRCSSAPRRGSPCSPQRRATSPMSSYGASTMPPPLGTGTGGVGAAATATAGAQLVAGTVDNTLLAITNLARERDERRKLAEAAKRRRCASLAVGLPVRTPALPRD